MSNGECIGPHRLLARSSIGRSLPALRRRMAALALQCRDKCSSKHVFDVCAIFVCAGPKSTMRHEIGTKAVRWVVSLHGFQSRRQDLTLT
jgi:hypothetical protein